MDAKRTVLIFATVLLMSSAASSDEETCSFHDKHLERAIYDFVAKLPAERVETVDSDDETPGESPPAANVTKFRFLGLNTLRPFGPFFTFCPNGTRVVQFDLANENPLVLIGSFTGDSSKVHEIESRAFLVRFTAQFAVTGSGETVKIHHRVNMPVSMTGLSFGIKGGDKDADEALASFTRTLPPHFLYDLWHGMLFSELEALFAEIAPKP
ncbi:uncharacterized protein LOC144135204 [Amblyomma americanum]